MLAPLCNGKPGTDVPIKKNIFFSEIFGEHKGGFSLKIVPVDAKY
jgi:hypothetical protein